MPGRGRSPVQQAWDYADRHQGCALGAGLELRGDPALRLRPRARGLRILRSRPARRAGGARDGFGFLSARTACSARPADDLLRETDNAYKDVTEELYKQYKRLRDRLIDFLVNAADGPRLTSLAAIEPAQKILDRILFIAFAAAHRTVARPAAGAGVEGAQRIRAAAALDKFHRAVPLDRQGQR